VPKKISREPDWSVVSMGPVLPSMLTPDQRLARVVAFVRAHYPYSDTVKDLHTIKRLLDNVCDLAEGAGEREGRRLGRREFDPDTNEEGPVVIVNLGVDIDTIRETRERVRLELLKRTGAAQLGEQVKPQLGATRWCRYLAAELERFLGRPPTVKEITAKLYPRARPAEFIRDSKRVRAALARRQNR
jgi:hypothetical protein